MADDRIHRITTDDGVEIAARVHGQGPPVMLVHGALEDGDTCWESMLPFLSDRFTCYAVHLRGRGLSGRSRDLSRRRHVQDLTAVAASIGGAVGLVGESGGGFMALGAAAQSDAVAALAVYEPVVVEAQTPEEAAKFRDVVERVDALAAAGRLDEGVRAFADWIGNDEETAALPDEAVEALTPNLLVQVDEFKQILDSLEEPGAYSPTDPAELARITAPVLVLRGSETARGDWFTECVRHVDRHVRETDVREIPGAGHFGTAFHPEPLAREIGAFFEKNLPAFGVMSAG
jgi:pimeloyl-ACP methyl ester carboxylesterase